MSYLTGRVSTDSDEAGREIGSVPTRPKKMAKFRGKKLQTLSETKQKYRAFHRFGQAKISYGGLVLGSSQFLLLPQLPQIMTLASKVVKIDSKIIISLP